MICLFVVKLPYEHICRNGLTYKGLEPGPLTSTGLLLDGHDLQHLVLKRGPKEVVDDLELFDGQGEEIDFLQRLDLALLHQATCKIV